MKNNLVLIICITASTIFFNSCKKDDIINNDPQPPTVTSDSTYLLTRAYGFETRTAAGNTLDSIYKITYIYDNFKRLIKSIDTFRIYSSSPAGSSLLINQYYYATTSDSLPYKSTALETGYGMSTTFHFYNTNGFLIKDSTSSLNNNGFRAVTNLSYSNNIIFIVTNDFDGSVSLLTRDTMILNTAGNVVETRGRQYTSAIPGASDLYYKTIYTYDNYKCPSITKIFYPITIGSKKNNQIKYVTTYWDGTTNQITGTESRDFSGNNTYNAAGYLTISKEIRTVPNPYEDRRTFFYTAY